MRLRKAEGRNINVSVSITKRQKTFLDKHPYFNFSRFVQMYLDDLIDLNLDVNSMNGKGKTK